MAIRRILEASQSEANVSTANWKMPIRLKTGIAKNVIDTMPVLKHGNSGWNTRQKITPSKILTSVAKDGIAPVIDIY